MPRTLCGRRSWQSCVFKHTLRCKMLDGLVGSRTSQGAPPSRVSREPGGGAGAHRFYHYLFLPYSHKFDPSWLAKSNCNAPFHIFRRRRTFGRLPTLVHYFCMDFSTNLNPTATHARSPITHVSSLMSQPYPHQGYGGDEPDNKITS